MKKATKIMLSIPLGLIVLIGVALPPNETKNCFAYFRGTLSDPDGTALKYDRLLPRTVSFVIVNGDYDMERYAELYDAAALEAVERAETIPGLR